MPSADVGRTALEGYYKHYYELTTRLKGTSGIVRAFAVHVANYQYLHPTSPIDPKNPFRYVTYYPPEYNIHQPENLQIQSITEKVLRLLKSYPTHKLLGFTFKSLMELDYSTFCTVEKSVLDIILEDKKNKPKIPSGSDLMDELE